MPSVNRLSISYATGIVIYAEIVEKLRIHRSNGRVEITCGTSYACRPASEMFSVAVAVVIVQGGVGKCLECWRWRRQCLGSSSDTFRKSDVLAIHIRICTRILRC
jgi:hypothetical protein